MSTNRYIDKLKARLAKEVDKRMQLQALLDDQVARNRALLAERDALRGLLEEAADDIRDSFKFAELSQADIEFLARIDAALQGEQP
ncbi:hypothetical protein OS670_19950 [Pseudomonadaceae bacterium T75]|nr:hypothetical protein OS670_19950 [Pseudomonadaceae bacterium T75]